MIYFFNRAAGLEKISINFLYLFRTIPRERFFQIYLKETDKIDTRKYIIYNYYAKIDGTSGDFSIAINNRHLYSQMHVKTLLVLYTKQ